MDPITVSSQIKKIADMIDNSEEPNRVLVASAIKSVIAAVEKNKDKNKKDKKISKKDVDTSTAASMHMSLLEKYKEFHDAGSNLLNFKGMITDTIPLDMGNDVVNAQKECAKAFDQLDAALKNARSAYSSFMAVLARF